MSKKVKKEIVVPVQPEVVQNKKNLTKPLVQHIIMFTIEGHTTYRINVFNSKESFDTYLLTQPNHPKVTSRKWFTVDRVTGTITEEK